MGELDRRADGVVGLRGHSHGATAQARTTSAGVRANAGARLTPSRKPARIHGLDSPETASPASPASPTAAPVAPSAAPVAPSAAPVAQRRARRPQRRARRPHGRARRSGAPGDELQGSDDRGDLVDGCARRDHFQLGRGVHGFG